MTRLSNWLIALALVIAVGALAAVDEVPRTRKTAEQVMASWQLDEPEIETAEEVAAEQAQAHIAEEKAQRIEKKTEWAEAVAWSPYR